MKKKFIIIFIWLIVITILINIFYYLIMENGINILSYQLAFKLKYYFRKVIEVEVDYNDLERNNVISKDNISVKLSNIDYKQDTGKLNVNLEFYTNNDGDVLEYTGGIARVYDDKKIFFNGPVGSLLDDMENMKYLLFSEDIYGNVEEGYKKLFGKLDYSNLNDTFESCIINTIEEDPITAELNLNLGEKYKIPDKLYISIIDLMYKSVDEFAVCKAIEPLGELKFIVNF